VHEPPTGTVALVFTDVQGSTALWEHGPALMREALAVHDEVLRRIIEERGGYEVKTEGDAFMVAFARAADAVRWCLDAQLALLDARWPEAIFDRPEAAIARQGDHILFRGLRVRMGAHIGEPDCRPDPVTGRMDYFGPVVNRAARVANAGHGGQTLISRAALTGAGSAIIDAEIIDLGEHRLKGLIASEHLYQVLPHRIVGRTFPPVRTMAAPRTNLSPTQSDLVGRGDERARLDASFSNGARLVTLVGPGGSGKTRLAREHALKHLDEYGGGAWFCDLSQARSGDDVQSAVAGVLGVSLPAGASPPVAQAVLGRAIAARDHLLFVLDNLEQVLDAAAPTLAAWIAGAPHAVFLATSREALGLGEEVTLELGALDEEAGLALLVDRARKAGADVDPVRDGAALRELTRKLDGLPLALELAAPRLRLLSPSQLTARLAQGIDLLKRAARDVPDRHTSLKAAIAASWDLLDTAERAAIAQATAFRGSFTIEAAEAVLSLDDDAPPVLDVVQALRDKSLLATHRTPGTQPRFSIYESVRAFVENVADPEERNAAGDRHAKHYVALGERLVRESEGPRAMHAFTELGREIDNLRAVLFCQHEAHPGLAARAALVLDHVLSVRGPGALRQEVLDAGLAASRACSTATARAKLHLARGKLALHKGDVDGALAELDAAEPAATGAADALLPRIWFERGQCFRRRGRRDEAAAQYSRAFDGARDDATRALVLDGRAALLQDQSRLTEAEADVRAAIEAAVRAGDRRVEARVRQNLGAILHDAGQLDGADEAYRAALEVARSLGDQRLEGCVLANLGNLLCDRGALVEARAMLDGALPLLEACGDVMLAGHALQYRGLVELRAGRFAQGRAALEQALEHHRAAGSRRFEGIDQGYLGIASLLSGDVRAARAALARADAALAEVGDAHMRALYAAFGATAAARAGEREAAAAAWTRAELADAPAWLAAVRGQLATAAGAIAAAAPPDDTTNTVLAAAVARGAA
jgi:predicted ATPase/class 3 adenylate cyclase/Tfp pilus assembly protein PilF